MSIKYKKKSHDFYIVAQRVGKVFFDTLKTLRNTRRQENRPDRRTRVRRGAVDAVSKNAFAQPFFTAVRNSFTYPILILYQIICLHFCGAWVYRQFKSHDFYIVASCSYTIIYSLLSCRPSPSRTALSYPRS